MLDPQFETRQRAAKGDGTGSGTIGLSELGKHLQDAPRPAAQPPPPMFPPSSILAQRDLLQEDQESLLSLWREQRLTPKEGVSLCEFMPHYGFSCSIAEHVQLEWKVCFSCKELRYFSPQKQERGTVYFDESLPQAEELIQALQRLLPHPDAAMIKQAMELHRSSKDS